MCGFAGILDSRADPGSLREAAAGMAAALLHRGPDDGGAWSDAPGVAFGFRRLAIQDLSAEGHQPMASASGRFTIVFNGEVYNFLELRRELEVRGVRFRGHSDTEVILAAFEAWGVRDSLPRMVGMFAMAIWDRSERILWLVRDRLGVKPLYYGVPGVESVHGDQSLRVPEGSPLLFGSELKAFAAHPRFDASIDREALADFMQYGYIPAPRSIWTGIRKLPPGCLLRYDPSRQVGVVESWWSARDAMLAGLESPLACSEDEAVDELQHLLDDAIRIRMIADVPLGAFLSGGIDSSVVVARMQAIGRDPVRTFTIGFDDPRLDESRHAEAVAKHLGTNHETRVVTGADALEVVPRLPEIWDEPFADASQIPTYLVCREARKSLTVVLSGDGGDEFFGGYRHYDRLPLLHAGVRRVPRPLRRWLADAAGLSSESGPAGWARLVLGKGTRRLQSALLGGTLANLGPYLTAEDELDCQHRYMSFWDARGGASVVLGAAPRPGGAPASWRLGAGDLRTRMRFADCVNYLPGDILAKVDRASMAVSLEAREPLLDHRLFEFAARVPPAMQVRDGRSRWLLRRVLYRSVPEGLIERPKQGFSPPYDAWLRGPLREWASELLEPARLRREELLDDQRVGSMWRRFVAGERSAPVTAVWNAVMFGAWLERWKRGSSVPSVLSTEVPAGPTAKDTTVSV